MGHPEESGNTGPVLSLRLLGPMELLRAGERVALPRSKKSRALLAYLALTQRAHRRERLCELFWDVADDPRGALRWTLSRLRSVISSDLERIEADRETVALRPEGLHIDACELAGSQGRALAAAGTPELEQLAALYRGELLEGLELPDFLDFSAWCIGQREQLRRAHCAVLGELIGRSRDRPEVALPFARRLVHADAFNVAAHQELLRLLLALGSVEEAQRRFAHAQRQFREVSAPDSDALERAWATLRAQAPPPVRSVVPPWVDAQAGVTPLRLENAPAPFVGRRGSLAQLEQLLDRARASGATEAALVTGEPGAGKSRLAERLRTRASGDGFEVLVGRAFEAERSRPFGPWVEALGVDVQQLVTVGASGSRELLFETLRARLVEIAKDRAGVLLVLDDLQWLDRDSAELLHYLMRTCEQGPLVVLLLARGGELADNEAATRVLRGLRRDRSLSELELEPLSEEDITALVGDQAGVDPAHILQASAGNPLYALELARAQLGGLQGPPPTLLQLIRERTERLPDAVADVLRWGAVLGHAIDLGRLEGLISIPQEELVDALERLERSALLRIDATRVHERYVFSHDVVREAVYGELSHPRRRLMHRRVALLLGPRASEAAVAYEVAHHAGLAGEALLGVRACITAGKHALRVFANGDAEALARRGLRLAEDLAEADRIAATLDLLHVLYTARTPDREEAAVQVRTLAERALDLGLTGSARLGFQMLSYLRWESSSMADAHANILQAERVSRAADPAERTQALAQAARCLVLLERNLGQAEAFVMEADAVASREGRSSAAISFARGMIAAHRGEFDGADEAFQEAQQLARAQGEHLVEFGAIEHRVMLELDRGRPGRAGELAGELVELAARLRPGAEVQAARALQALAQLCDRSGDEAELQAAAAALRRADANYELSFVLTRWAEHSLSLGRVEEARRQAADALEVAQVIGRSSEIAIALAQLTALAHRCQDLSERDRHRERLDQLAAGDLSAIGRERLRALRAFLETSGA